MNSSVCMKWKEAYQCKVCEQIYKHKRDTYCIKCGAHITEQRGMGSRILPAPRYATKNLRPVIIRRKWFKLEVKPSRFPEGLIQGRPPPWD